ncbi:HlyD family type I secretion periplasmic adaptor subunit [Neptunomonas qingdaonensis]|uniref:Membrane fusion protein (MFP) family protein n=1 Tax=Neptunomonas qingdaonensis TaxID=1045558 RepID=A0A1I2PC77_9GAMM|nr:HlyD family type I secretion periplasmic adaptor subunit [Neptunomonas qingdaonensis]SFG13708.1 hemolysin D [Neptunomonas qingdaonensis]
MNLFNAFKEAWLNRDQLGDKHNMRELAAFLPAALEIQETPPNPLAKWIGRSLILLFCLALLWAYFGEVNIVATAEGKIIPSSRVKVIQPIEKALVKRILVKEGQTVAEGQPLIELDRVLTASDEKRLLGDLQSAQLLHAVSQTLMGMLDKPVLKQRQLTASQVSLSVTDTLTTSKDQRLHKRLLWQQWQQYRAQLQAFQSALSKTKAEQEGTRAIISKLTQILPIITRRTANLKNLNRKKYISETEYLALEQERIQQTQDLVAERQRLKQLQASESEIQQQINGYMAQTRATHLNSMAETQQQIAALQEELAKATDLDAKQILYSPVSGQVQGLAVNTVGGVVTEAQQLMLVVPDEEHLSVEVYLQNKDIGFVHETMPAEVKIHTFPFTKYGIIDAKVITVSDDAKVDEQQGLIYSMQLIMDKNTIWVDGKNVKLIPGMAVTAEVKTGKRRIIEFFLAPLLRYGQEGLRER